MKKTIFFMLVIASIVCQLTAGEPVKINGNFTKVYNDLPIGWSQNKGKWAKPFGQVKLIKDTSGKNVVEIVSTEKDTHLLYYKLIPAVAGDKFKLTLKVEGSGRVGAGIYVYNDKRRWMTNNYKYSKLTPVLQDKSFIITVKDAAEKKAAFVKVIIIGCKESTVQVSEIKLEKQ